MEGDIEEPADDCTDIVLGGFNHIARHWAIANSVIELMQFLGDWTYYVLLVDLPKYMNDVLHVSVKENGFYSSIPWSMFVPVSLLSSYLCDWLISSGRFDITRTRKLFVIVCEYKCCFSDGVCLIDDVLNLTPCSICVRWDLCYCRCVRRLQSAGGGPLLCHFGRRHWIANLVAVRECHRFESKLQRHHMRFLVDIWRIGWHPGTGSGRILDTECKSEHVWAVENDSMLSFASILRTWVDCSVKLGWSRSEIDQSWRKTSKRWL